MQYNIYCDESCHLEHDGNDIIVLGGIGCPKEKAKQINRDILSIKENFGIPLKSEIKWTKVSPSNKDFYIALIDYFFSNDDLTFRGYVGRGKTELKHETYGQDYDTWYYKMYYRMLEFILDYHRNDDINIYLDIKDTIGKTKVVTLKKYFNAHYSQNIVKRIQLERSEHVALIQLTDVFIGALSYKNRYLKSSFAKLTLIDRIEELSKQNLLSSVPLKNRKANWFIWVPDSWR